MLKASCRPRAMFALECLASGMTWSALVMDVQCVEAGAHMIGIKDMAGLLKPRAAAPLMQAIREVRRGPIHHSLYPTAPQPSHGTLCGCVWGSGDVAAGALPHPRHVGGLDR